MGDLDISARGALSVDETAAYLGVHASFVRRLIDQGRLPSVRLGRRVLVPVEGLQEVLRGQ